MSKRARKHRHSSQPTPPQGLTLATAALLGLLVTPGVVLANQGVAEDGKDVRGNPTSIFRGKVEDKCAVVVDETIAAGDPPVADPRTIIGHYEDENSSDATGGNASDNTVEIHGGTIKKTIHGGTVETADKLASGNTVTISGGTVQHVRGGNNTCTTNTDATVVAKGNVVEADGSKIDGHVYGNYAESGSIDGDGETNVRLGQNVTVGGECLRRLAGVWQW